MGLHQVAAQYPVWHGASQRFHLAISLDIHPALLDNEG